MTCILLCIYVSISVLLQYDSDQPSVSMLQSLQDCFQVSYITVEIHFLLLRCQQRERFPLNSNERKNKIPVLEKKSKPVRNGPIRNGTYGLDNKEAECVWSSQAEWRRPSRELACDNAEAASCPCRNDTATRNEPSIQPCALRIPLLKGSCCCRVFMLTLRGTRIYYPTTLRVHIA